MDSDALDWPSEDEAFTTALSSQLDGQAGVGPEPSQAKDKSSRRGLRIIHPITSTFN
jgi:hypothetical protein